MNNFPLNTNPQPTVINVILVPDINNVDGIPVNPGTSVMFLNEKMTEFKMRSRDTSGFANPDRTWAMKETTPVRQSTNTVSREEFNQMQNSLAEIKKMLEDFTK